MNKKFKSFLQLAIFFGLGIFLVWLSLKDLFVDTPEAVKSRSDLIFAITNANYSWLVLSLVLAVLSHLSRAVRWKMLLEPMGYRPKTSNAFFAVMVGYLLNLAIPRLGEVSRCGVLFKYEKIPVQKALGTVVVERAVDLLFLGLVVLLSLFFHYQLLIEKINEKLGAFGGKTDMLMILAGGGLLGLLILFLLRKQIKKLSFYDKLVLFVKGLLEGLKSIGQLKSPLLFIGHSIFIWVMYLLMIYLCFFCFNETSGLGIDKGITALAYGSFAMIATPGGLGAYPVVIEEVMGVFGISETFGMALGWLVWAAQTAMMLVFGVLSLSLLAVLNKKVNEAPEDATTQDA